MLLVDDVADAPPLVLSPDPIVGPIIRNVYQFIGERLGLKFAGTIIKGGEPTMIGPRPSLTAAKWRHTGVATYRLEGFARGKAGAYFLSQRLTRACKLMEYRKSRHNPLMCNPGKLESDYAYM